MQENDTNDNLDIDESNSQNNDKPINNSRFVIITMIVIVLVLALIAAGSYFVIRSVVNYAGEREAEALANRTPVEVAIDDIMAEGRISKELGVDQDDLYNTGIGLYRSGDYRGAKRCYAECIERGAMNAGASMTELGVLFYEGSGVEQDYTLALEFFKEAVNMDFPTAFGFTAYMYYYGLGTEIDYERAFHYASMGIEMDDAISYEFIGWMYYYGEHVEQDIGAAVKYYEMGVDAGSAMCALELGRIYYYGDYGDIDYEMAFNMFNRAVDLGSANAHGYLGHMYYVGTYVEENYTAAYEYFNTGAYDYDDPYCYYCLGLMYYSGHYVEADTDMAYELLSYASQNGNVSAEEFIAENFE